jgi:PAS domain S-box-containing protein
MTISTEGKISDVNQAAALYAGVPRDTLIGSDFSQSFTEPDKAALACKEAFASGFVRDCPLTIRNQNGQCREVLLNASVYRNGADQVQGVVASARDITERKQAEENLKASEAFLKSTIDGLSAHIAVLNDRGEIILVNKAYRDFATRNGGDPRAVLEGANYLTVCDNASGKEHEEAISFADGIRAVLSGERRQFELEYLCHSPEQEAWYLARVTTFSGEGPRRAIVAHEDITKRVQAEAQLRVKAIAVASSSAGIAFADMDGRINYANPAWLRMHGYDSEADVIGTTPNDHVRDAADAITTLEGIKRDGSWNGEIECRRRDGSFFLAELACGLLTDPAGRPVGMMASFLDITERRQAEEGLARINTVNLARLALIEYSYHHDVDELLEECVNVAERLTGSIIGFIHFVDDDQQALVLQNWSTQTRNAFCRAEAEGMHCAIAEAGVWADCVHQRKPVIHNDYNALTHKKGLPEGHAPLERELVVPVLSGGNIKAILGVGNKQSDYNDDDVEALSLIASLAWEIVERKNARDELRNYKDHLEVLVAERTRELTQSQEALVAAKEAAESANHAKSTFLANMSHEIRTPLNAILGFAQIIEHDPDLALEHVARVRSINRAGQHLLTIINDILDMAKIEAGLVQLNVSATSLHDLLSDLLMMLRSRAEAKGLHVTMERAPSVPHRVLCDAGKLRQILFNLIGNAVKFTQSGGVVVRVHAEQADDIAEGSDHASETGIGAVVRLVIEIEDSGPGIPSEELDRIFSAFI